MSNIKPDKLKKQTGGDVHKNYFNTLADYIRKYGWGKLTNEQKQWYRQNYPKFKPKTLSDQEYKDVLSRQKPMEVIESRIPQVKAMLDERDKVSEFVNSAGFVNNIPLGFYDDHEKEMYHRNYITSLRDSLGQGYYDQELLKERFGEEAAKNARRNADDPFVAAISTFPFDGTDITRKEADYKRKQDILAKLNKNLKRPLDFAVTHDHPALLKDPKTLAFYQPSTDSIYIRPNEFKPGTIREEVFHWSDADNLRGSQGTLDNIDMINKNLQHIKYKPYSRSHLEYLSQDFERKAKEYSTRRYLEEQGYPLTTDFSADSTGQQKKKVYDTLMNAKDLPSNAKEWVDIYLENRGPNIWDTYKKGGYTNNHNMNNFTPTILHADIMQPIDLNTFRFKSGGYTVSRSDRKGKTHKVTGPDGTVKHFGDPNLKNKPKDPKAKKAWYARHAKSLKNNPHFRAYARKTWKEGGYATTPEEYEMGLLVGKNKFKMPFTANHNMTMTPRGLPISFPVYYEGLVKGMKTDSGVALPGQDFQVYGDEVREYPMYQTGGNLNRLAPRAVNVRSDYKYDPNANTVPSFSPQKRLRIGVANFKIPADYGKPKGIDDKFIMKDDSNPLPLKVSDEKPITYTYEKLKGKKGGYLKDKNTYVTKDGKETRRGIWANTYLKKKREGKLQRGGDANKYGTIPQGEWDAIYGASAPAGDKPSFLSKVKDTVKSALTTDENYDPYKVQSFDIPYASMAYNLARAAEGPDKELVRTNPYQSEVINTAKYNRVRPNFRPMEMAQNKLASQVRGSVGSVPSMMSNMQNVTSNTQRNMADTALQAANQNAQLTANYANTLSQEGWRTAQEQGRVDDLNQRNKAAHFAHLAEVAAGVDSARKQQRVLGDADRFTDMELTATNATASDVKFVRLPNGRIVQYYRDPITGEFKPVELKGLS